MTELHPSVLAEDLRLHADAIRHPDIALARTLEQAAEQLAELTRLRGIEQRAREIWARADDEPMAAPSALVAARYILGEKS